MEGVAAGKIILREITLKRKMLIEVAERKGINSADTIRCSQELDEMINSFYKWLNAQAKMEQR